MEEQVEIEAVTAFDTLYTSNQIQMLKILIPYIDSQIQRKLVVMIKFMELQYTFEYCGRHPAALGAASIGNEPAAKPDIISLFDQLKNFCSPSQRAMFEQISSMKKSMEMYEQMMEAMQMFSQNPSEENADAPMDDASSTFNPMDMLKGMLTPEQQAMFEMFQSN